MCVSCVSAVPVCPLFCTCTSDPNKACSVRSQLHEFCFLLCAVSLDSPSQAQTTSQHMQVCVRSTHPWIEQPPTSVLKQHHPPEIQGAPVHILRTKTQTQNPLTAPSDGEDSARCVCVKAEVCVRQGRRAQI